MTGRRVCKLKFSDVKTLMLNYHMARACNPIKRTALPIRSIAFEWILVGEDRGRRIPPHQKDLGQYSSLTALPLGE